MSLIKKNKKEYDRKHYLENRDKIREQQKQYYEKHKSPETKYRCLKLQAIRNLKTEERKRIRKEQRRTEREQILNLLGNQCIHCGITDIRVLQIDHVNGNGYQDVIKWGHGRPYYKHILDVKGEGYQLLCANCNWIKRYERHEHN